MDEVWQYITIYIILVAALLIEVVIAVNWQTLGTLSAAGVLVIASIQAIFGFLYFMHGKYGNKAIIILMIISLATIIPLFFAFLYSIEIPLHLAALGEAAH